MSVLLVLNANTVPDAVPLLATLEVLRLSSLLSCWSSDPPATMKPSDNDGNEAVGAKLVPPFELVVVEHSDDMDMSG